MNTNFYEYQERELWKTTQNFNVSFSCNYTFPEFTFKRPKLHREAILLVGPPFCNKGIIYKKCIIPLIEDKQNVHLISDIDVKIMCENDIDEVSCKLKQLMMIPENKKLIIDTYWAYPEDVVALVSGLNRIGVSIYDIHVIYCLKHPKEIQREKEKFVNKSEMLSDLVLYTQYSGHIKLLESKDEFMARYCCGDWWCCYSKNDNIDFYCLRCSRTNENFENKELQVKLQERFEEPFELI